MNLLITMKCNRACSYCFAKEKLHSYAKSDTNPDMSLEDLEKVLKFLLKNNCRVVQLAGGEPTLHPKFREILSALISKEIQVNILSNALWNPKLNYFLGEISPNFLGFLLNIDKPETYSTIEWDIIQKNMEFLSNRGNVTLSFNIQEKNPSYGYIFDLVSKYHIKNLRLSFSMPVNFGEKKNVHLQIEDYKLASKDIIDFVKKAESLGATVGMDNAIPVCMFSPEELSELMIKQVVEPSRNFVCYPAIDIGPDLSVWRCFGTSKLFNKKLDDFASLEEMYEYYQRVSRLYQFKFFPMEECESCEHAKAFRCQGGCIGFAESNCAERGFQVKDQTDDDLLEMKPRLSNEVSLRSYKLPKETLTVHFQNGNEMEIPSSVADLLDLLDGKTSIREAVARRIYGDEKREDSDGFDDFLLDLSAQKVIPIIRRLVDQKVLLV